MYRPQSSVYLRFLRNLVVLTLSILCASNILLSRSQPTDLLPVIPQVIVSLPQQQIWKHGISSFLFGTNDTQEWYANNVETNTAIQQALKDAHFTLMRTFFFDKSPADNHATTDMEIEQRLRTIEQSGMVCLGVLANIDNTAFNEHVVSYAGKRCQIYEFGNEPDAMDISVKTYLQQWNSAIPLLRQINPSAKFIGPVMGVDDPQNKYLRGFLAGVKQSRELPDAVSFHWYPCWQDSQDGCMAKVNSFYQKTMEVRMIIKSVLGKDLPVGITEWNYDSGNPPPAYDNDPNFIEQFSTSALQSMIWAGVTFACQFDAASYSGYGLLDMFNLATNQPKPQYYAIKNLIDQYRIPYNT